MIAYQLAALHYDHLRRTQCRPTRHLWESTYNHQVIAGRPGTRQRSVCQTCRTVRLADLNEFGQTTGRHYTFLASPFPRPYLGYYPDIEVMVVVLDEENENA